MSPAQNKQSAHYIEPVNAQKTDPLLDITVQLNPAILVFSYASWFLTSSVLVSYERVQENV